MNKNYWQLNVDHLKNSEMSYWHHWRHSFRYGILLIWLGICSILHAFIPLWFQYYSAQGVVKIYQRIRHMNHLTGVLRKRVDID